LPSAWQIDPARAGSPICASSRPGRPSGRARNGEREAGKGQVPPASSKPHGGPDSAGGGDTCIMPAPENAPAPPASRALGPARNAPCRE